MKQVFPFFVLHKLDIAKLYYSTNILIHHTDQAYVDHGNSMHKHACMANAV